MMCTCIIAMSVLLQSKGLRSCLKTGFWRTHVPLTISQDKLIKQWLNFTANQYISEYNPILVNIIPILVNKIVASSIDKTSSYTKLIEIFTSSASLLIRSEALTFKLSSSLLSDTELK